MESSGRFEKIFFKMLREQNIAGADGAFGDGPSVYGIYNPPRGTINSNDNSYAERDGRLVKVLGKGKVQTRKGSAGGKKKKKKKKTDGLDGVFLTGEEDEEAKGLDTGYVDIIIPPSSPEEQYELIVKYTGKAFADKLPPEYLGHESIHAIQIRDDILNPNKIKEEIDLEGVDFDDFEADRERKRVYFSRPPEIMAFAYDVATQSPKPPGVEGA